MLGGCVDGSLVACEICVIVPPGEALVLSAKYSNERCQYGDFWLWAGSVVVSENECVSCTVKFVVTNGPLVGKRFMGALYVYVFVVIWFIGGGTRGIW